MTRSPVRVMAGRYHSIACTERALKQGWNERRAGPGLRDAHTPVGQQAIQNLDWIDSAPIASDDVVVIEVRPAGESDVARVLELLSQLFERDVTQEPARAASLVRMLDSDRAAVLVAVEAEVVHGVITFSCNLAARFDTSYAQIEELVVDAAARGKNAGAALVTAAMVEARRRGCEEMGLYPREETRAFYERLGFEYVGVELRQRLR